MPDRPTIHWDSTHKAYCLATSVVVPAPRSEVFAFFSDAENLEFLTPPWLKFRIITPRPLTIRQGALIDYRIQLRFVPIRWRTEIAEWEPDDHFTDRQVRGPYRMWEHQHLFSDAGTGTLMEDLVRYRVPGGALAHSLFVRRDLERIFAYRQQKMLERFGGRPAEEVSLV